MRPNRLISCLAIVGTTLAFAAVPAGADSPSVSATPNKKLADGQQVMVSASGFAPNTSMAVVECPTSTVSPDACDLNTVNFTITDDTGAYTDFPFTVSRILGDGTDCALNGGCYIGTQDDAAAGPTAATLIKFDPNIPPIPPLEVGVHVNRTLRVNDKGVVQVTGTVKCTNRGADVQVNIDLTQIVDRAIFESFGFADVLCAADTRVPFRATVRPANGIFGPGDALVRYGAFAGNLFVQSRQAVQLIPHPHSGAHSSVRPTLTWR